MYRTDVDPPKCAGECSIAGLVGIVCFAKRYYSGFATMVRFVVGYFNVRLFPVRNELRASYAHP